MKNIAKMSERTYQNHSKYYSDYDLKFAISKLFDNIIDRYFLCEKKTFFNVHNICTGGINIIYFFSLAFTVLFWDLAVHQLSMCRKNFKIKPQ